MSKQDVETFSDNLQSLKHDKTELKPEDEQFVKMFLGVSQSPLSFLFICKLILALAIIVCLLSPLTDFPQYGKIQVLAVKSVIVVVLFIGLLV